MIEKLNELLCANSKWHRYERLAAMCRGAIHGITFAITALTFYWIVAGQTISNRLLWSLLAVEVAFLVLHILFLRRTSKGRDEFYDKAEELVDSLYKTKCEPPCKPWLANWSDGND